MDLFQIIFSYSISSLYKMKIVTLNIYLLLALWGELFIALKIYLFIIASIMIVLIICLSIIIILKEKIMLERIKKY